MKKWQKIIWIACPSSREDRYHTNYQPTSSFLFGLIRPTFFCSLFPFAKIAVLSGFSGFVAGGACPQPKEMAEKNLGILIIITLTLTSPNLSPSKFFNLNKKILKPRNISPGSTEASKRPFQGQAHRNLRAMSWGVTLRFWARECRHRVRVCASVWGRRGELKGGLVATSGKSLFLCPFNLVSLPF